MGEPAGREWVTQPNQREPKGTGGEVGRSILGIPVIIRRRRKLKSHLFFVFDFWRRATENENKMLNNTLCFLLFSPFWREPKAETTNIENRKAKKHVIFVFVGS